MQSASPEMLILTELFRAFSKHRVKYAVLRNWATLPETLSGSDLDLLIWPVYRSLVPHAISEAVATTGGTIIGFSASSCFTKICSFGKTGTANAQWWGLCIDCNFGLCFRGSPVINMHHVDRWVANHRELKVITNGLAPTLAVIKEVLNNGRVPQHYKRQAHRSADAEWRYVSQVLSPLGYQGLQFLRNILCRDSDAADLARDAAALSHAFAREALKSSPLLFIGRRLQFEWSKFRRYLAPSGAVFAVLGVDGSGKSTVINSIKPILDSATHNATFVRHLRPGLLPPLARLKGKIDPPDGPVLSPHGSSPSGVVGSLLRLTWLTVDYILGYWLRIRPIIAKQPAIVIFDRYAYDMALDPRRFRIGLPGWVAGLFARLAPRPDLIICLHASPEVIAQRKQELPLEETRRQLEALVSFAESQPNAVLISTDGSIEEVRERVLRTLFDFFQKRANHRYKHDRREA